MDRRNFLTTTILALGTACSNLVVPNEEELFFPDEEYIPPKPLMLGQEPLKLNRFTVKNNRGYRFQQGYIVKYTQESADAHFWYRHYPSIGGCIETLPGTRIVQIRNPEEILTIDKLIEILGHEKEKQIKRRNLNVNDAFAMSVQNDKKEEEIYALEINRFALKESDNSEIIYHNNIVLDIVYFGTK